MFMFFTSTGLINANDDQEYKSAILNDQAVGIKKIHENQSRKTKEAQVR